MGRAAPRLIGLVATLVVVWLGLMWISRDGPRAYAQGSGFAGPRTPDGKPDLNGIWQVVNTANVDLEPHSAQEGEPAGQGVVDGGTIPYQAWALAKKKENYAKRKTADPLSKCYLPGVPRATYVPMPFEITQTPKYVVIAYEFAHARRIIYTDGSPHVEALEFWMGDSRGHWEGATLVVSTNNFTDKTWFDQAGNFHSASLHVVERFTPVSADHMNYEATIEDEKVFTRPWKISMPIYRRQEKGLQLLEYDCVGLFWRKTLSN
jgi:hypothetical protein